MVISAGLIVLEDFAENDEPAAKGLDERERGLVGERWCDKRRRFGRYVAPKQQDASAGSKKCLQFGEELLLDSDGANGDDVLRFVELRASQQILGARGFDGCVVQIEVPDGLAKKG